ncbi:transglutaminase-like domain-containing protein, partial [Enterobacter hormaechei]|uniref:transglutaminase-like domain-containing protein n=1 Tax=Enterobacter hormaechei TaxID=158836 RepID=UPI00312C8F6E
GTDSAVTTLMTGQGVCRDYAHVVISLLRAMDVPARYAACYAPGLNPMDFHAVAEAYLEGSWYVIDATRLANRHSLVRISTGRDAADCAFLSYHGANVVMPRLRVDAWAMPDASSPDAVEADLATDEITDDFTALVQLA